jgi:hypothetical protein
LSDCQLTNFCVGWYDGGTGKMWHWEHIEFQAFSSDMNVQLLDRLLWWPCNARCKIMQFCVQNQPEQFVTLRETKESHIQPHWGWSVLSYQGSVQMHIKYGDDLSHWAV